MRAAARLGRPARLRFVRGRDGMIRCTWGLAGRFRSTGTALLNRRRRARPTGRAPVGRRRRAAGTKAVLGVARGDHGRGHAWTVGVAVPSDRHGQHDDHHDHRGDGGGSSDQPATSVERRRRRVPAGQHDRRLAVALRLSRVLRLVRPSHPRHGRPHRASRQDSSAEVAGVNVIAHRDRQYRDAGNRRLAERGHRGSTGLRGPCTIRCSRHLSLTVQRCLAHGN